MMRSPTCIATAVRTRNGIVVKSEPYVSLARRHKFLGIPIVRGAVAFIETMGIAVSTLSYSAQMVEVDSSHEAGEHGKGRSSSSRLSVIGMIVIAFILGFGLFFYLPLVLTELSGLRHGVMFNLVDGGIRLGIMILYIVLITRWKEMKRIFEYHGAEHKAIAAFESEGKATVENARAYSTVHSRCSTSFLLLVVIVSVVVFIFLGRPESIADKLVRFAFIPVIGGLAYEVLRLSTRPLFRRWFAPVLWPGYTLQRFTTAEPNDEQIEVAIAALDACIAEKPVES